MSEESVGRIHSRFYLTLINPESHVTSLAVSFSCATLIIFLSSHYYFEFSFTDFLITLPLSLAVLYAAKIIDLALLRKLPIAKNTKVYHTAAFANMIWLSIVILGIVASFVLSKPAIESHYVVVGMFLAMGLRIGIFASVFGASLLKTLLVAPILPLLFLTSFAPLESIPDLLLEPMALGFGLSFFAIASVWVAVADRAGRPDVDSTFGLLQAYLLAWTERKPEKMESIMEGRSKQSRVNTYSLELSSNGALRSIIVVPDVHPGPFYPVGGSDLPHEIYKEYSSKSAQAIVMHSISDHSLNLPSRSQVENYISSLGNGSVLDKGSRCTEPIVIQVNKARVTGIAFGRTAMLMLSLSPYGMEDIPEIIRKEVESYASEKDFTVALVIDTHNSVGEHLDEDDASDMLKACKVILDELKKRHQFAFGYGICHSSEIGVSPDDVGPAGMSVLSIRVNGKTYAIGWVDGNNMVRDLRERIVDLASSENVSMLEVCTSDTHYTSGRARNLTGYFTFGSLSPTNSVSKWYLEMTRKAVERISDAGYEVSRTQSDVKVMGSMQFSDYSSALDRSLNVTKVSLGVTVALYIVLLVLG